MEKFLLKFFILLLVIIISFTAYITYFGLETDQFDNLIKKNANALNKNVQLEFKKTKIHLSPINFSFVVKLKNPKVLIKSDEINLSKLNLFLPIKSFFNSNFFLKRAEIAFNKNDIKDLTKITNIFVPKIINKKIKKIFAKGKIDGEFIIPFDGDGDVGKDYGFTGKVLDATINLTEKFNIKNLTAEINHTKDSDGNLFNIKINAGSIFDLELKDTRIDLERKNNETQVNSSLITNGELNFLQIKQLLFLLNLDVSNFKDFKGKGDFKTGINFALDKNYRIRNLNYSIEGIIPFLEVYLTEKKIIEEYLPDYNNEIILKDSIVKIVKTKFSNTIDLTGLIKTKDNFDSIKIKETYDYKNKNFNINGIVDLTNSKINIPQLNYTKDRGRESEVKFDFNFSLDKYYTIIKLIFVDDKTKINLSNVNLNKNFEIKDFKQLKIKTINNEIKNNDFIVEKSKKTMILGEVFDAQPLLKSLYNKDEKKTFSKNFSSKIKINFDKVITGTNDDVSGFGMIATINKGSYDKLSLKGNFSENEMIEMSIYQIDNDKKTLHLISDRARPFIKNFDFIEGFEGGKLEYESTILKEISNSDLTITDFKVSKVPALAKLLTLASLQGIADTLSGEGIRFESFEMKSNLKGNVMNIEDAIAIGPAVSILLDGYVDKGKVVSLRGTLVPATKLNSIIASIPIVGDILVGKKTGEGVMGVSFKLKGPPKDIKTSVNPIKTLTPRFIVRALEKIKKMKQEEAK